MKARLTMLPPPGGAPELRVPRTPAPGAAIAQTVVPTVRPGERT